MLRARQVSSLPRIAAAIAYAELNGKRNGWKDPAELWGDMSEDMRRDYRKMARAAMDEMEAGPARERAFAEHNRRVKA